MLASQHESSVLVWLHHPKEYRSGHTWHVGHWGVQLSDERNHIWAPEVYPLWKPLRVAFQWVLVGVCWDPFPLEAYLQILLTQWALSRYQARQRARHLCKPGDRWASLRTPSNLRCIKLTKYGAQIFKSNSKWRVFLTLSNIFVSQDIEWRVSNILFRK